MEAKILKGDSSHNGWSQCEADENLGLVVLGAAWVGFFRVWFFEFRLGVSRCTLQNFRC